MTKKINLVKNGGALWPSTDADKELMRELKHGRPYAVEVTRQSARSLDHLRLYWSGLIKLMLDYWQPEGGTLSPNEDYMLDAFVRHLTRNESDETKAAILDVSQEFKARVRAKRADQFEVEVKPDDIHEWIKEEVGYYDVVLTPRGPRKRLKSINFNAMSQEEFNDYYRKAFNAAWKFVLSRRFANEADAESAIAQLMEMAS